MKVLELAGGNNPYYCKALSPDYCNVDARPGRNVDWCHDLSKLPLPFADGEWDRVFSRYFLEHVPWRKTKEFISEIYRIVKAGGSIYIVTSNLKVEAEILSRELPYPDKSNLQLFVQNTTGMIYGDHDYAENSHAGSMGPEVLEILFKEAGFRDVHIYPVWSWSGDLVIEARK